LERSSAFLSFKWEGSPTKCKEIVRIRVNTTSYIYIYIYINEKSIPEYPGNHWRLVEEDQIYKIEKFNKIFSTNKGLIGK
jgi:protoporphyrinogen oxidase